MDMFAPQKFTADDFARRARMLSNMPEDADFGDHALNPSAAKFWAADRVRLREAAVLVPVIERGDGASVILTRRNDKLRNHSGQISFPGGRVDPDDTSPRDTALREAHEEIGLESTYAEPLGQLPRYISGSGYSITPVLAHIQKPVELTANPDEVAEIFEVPLAFLMNPANHHRESRIFNGHERFYYTMPYHGHFIWGITAGIIRGIYERLYR